ncbi:hypothetical protein SDC9_124934 [bioreactor metagenome]|uniref:Uncharacterized protein n=1 Tax=bioreactor metagenome TaxID=1076179 RepID=A0A645CLZ3_9ZZZZ
MISGGFGAADHFDQNGEEWFVEASRQRKHEKKSHQHPHRRAEIGQSGPFPAGLGHFGRRRHKIFADEEQRQEPAQQKGRPAQNEGPGVAEIVHDHAPAEEADHIARPQRRAQGAEGEAMVFLRRGGDHQRLGGADRTRKDRRHETDDDQPEDRRREHHHREDDAGHEIGAQQHEFAAVPVADGAPQRIGDAEAQHAEEVEGRDIDAALGFLADAETLADIERNKRQGQGSPGHGQNLSQPDHEQILSPADGLHRVRNPAAELPQFRYYSTSILFSNPEIAQILEKTFSPCCNATKSSIADRPAQTE